MVKEWQTRLSNTKKITKTQLIKPSYGHNIGIL